MIEAWQIKELTDTDRYVDGPSFYVNEISQLENVGIWSVIVLCVAGWVWALV